MSVSLAQITVILALLAIYGLITWGLTFLLRKLGVPSKWAIFLGFLAFGIGAGFWASLAWPLDSITLLNLPAALFGDALYQGSIQYLGDPSSSQAHYTIPWFLRIPKVYVLASIVLWGLLGLIAQLISNWQHQHRQLARGATL